MKESRHNTCGIENLRKTETEAEEHDCGQNNDGRVKESLLNDVCEADEKEDMAPDDLLSLPDEKFSQLPIDRGWAWVILLAFVAVHFIIIGQMKCMGIVFIQLQLRYRSSSSATSLIYTMMNAAYSVSALVILTVGSALSVRKSVAIGAIITTISSLLTAFIDDVNVAMVVIGVAIGIANAFIMPPFSTLVSVYFEKKRGFANNIGNSGVSLGAIALAPILTILFDQYGYTGTYILITGFNMQVFVIACLLRPMSMYVKRLQERKEGKIRRLSKMEYEKRNHLINNSNDGSTSVEKNDCLNGKQEKLSKINVKDMANSEQECRKRFVSESDSVLALKRQLSGVTSSAHSIVNSGLARFASTDVINNSMLDLTLTNPEEVDYIKASADNKPNVSNKSSILQVVCRSLSKLFDRKLLSKPEFQYYLVCNFFLCAGSSLASAFLPPLAVEMGISNEFVALMVSIQMSMDFFSRFVFGIISDKNLCHRSTLIAIACFVLGISAQFVHFMTTFSTIMIYAVICGMFQGVYFSLFIVVILDILSFDDLKGALGFISLVQGAASGISMPIVGYIRDNSGTYTYTFNFVGCLIIIGAVLVYFVPNVHEWSRNREKTNIEEEVHTHMIKNGTKDRNDRTIS